MKQPPVLPCNDGADRETPAIMDLLPEESNKAYDMKDFINEVFDEASFFEVHAEYAKNVVVGFARLNGRTVGIFAKPAENICLQRLI